MFFSPNLASFFELGWKNTTKSVCRIVGNLSNDIKYKEFEEGL